MHNNIVNLFINNDLVLHIQLYIVILNDTHSIVYGGANSVTSDAKSGAAPD